MEVDLPEYRKFITLMACRSNQVFPVKWDTPFPFSQSNSAIRRFVQGMYQHDDKFDATDAKINYSRWDGVPLATVGEIIMWSRKFVHDHFPEFEKKIVLDSLLNLDYNKEVVWVGPDYLASSVNEIIRLHSPTKKEVKETEDLEIETEAEVKTTQKATNSAKPIVKWNKNNRRR